MKDKTMDTKYKMIENAISRSVEYTLGENAKKYLNFEYILNEDESKIIQIKISSSIYCETNINVVDEYLKNYFPGVSEYQLNENINYLFKNLKKLFLENKTKEEKDEDDRQHYLKFCENGVSYLENMPIHMVEKHAKRIVGKSGLALKYLPDKCKNTEICEIAVSKSGSALKYVPEKLKTARMCRRAVKKTKSAINFVPNKF